MPNRDLQEHLFFCVRPDTETGALIDECRRWFVRDACLDGKLRDQKLLHITLHGAGEYESLPNHVIAAAKRTGDTISMSPFWVTLHAIGSFRKRAETKALVLYARSHGLRALHKGLAVEMRSNGFRRVHKSFNPHMTLHYCSSMVLERPINPISFMVTEFFFIHSEWGRSRHNVINRWILGD